MIYANLGEGIKLEVPQERKPKIEPKGTVKMGIRPQDILIEQDSKLRTEVLLIEPMGRDDLIVCRVGNIEIHFLVDPVLKLKRGDSVGLKFDMEKAQFFDTETGKSLLWV